MFQRQHQNPVHQRPMREKYLNKSNSTKSIFSFYVRFNRVPREHDIMSSYKNLEDAIRNEYNQHQDNGSLESTSNCAAFEYTSKLTGLKIQHKIEILEDIQKQDILKWSRRFQELASMCGWTEDGRLEVLSHIINPEIRSKITYTGRTDGILESILRLKYNPSRAHYYYQKLSNIKQENYYLIQTYAKEIRNTCQKLALCCNWTDELLKEKTEEAFFINLENHVKIEMERMNKYLASEICETIEKIENMIIEEINTQASPNKRENNTYEKTTQKRRERNHKYARQKFCDYHKTSNHSNEECRHQKNSNAGTYKNDKSKGYAICESVSDPRTLEMKININNKEMDCLIDTGASFNFIPKHLLNDLTLDSEEIKREIQVETASGESIKCTSLARCEFFLNNDTKCRYKSSFYIFESKSNNIILGMKFLRENDAIINLKDNYINLDNREYEIGKERSNLDMYEQDIVTKTTVFSINKTDKDFKELKDIMKTKNPKLGHISTFEHEIELAYEFTPKFKEYSVPLAIKKDVENHLKELEDAKIIIKCDSKMTSPAFVIKKKNGNIRLVIDYRELNKATKPIYVSFPKITDILHDLKDSTIFSTLDLNQGYYQIPIRKQDIEKTSFRICGNTYAFNRMPFGLTNAPRTFTKAMKSILDDMNYVKVYMDDILIHSKDSNEHYDHVKTVLNKLLSAGASINFEKSVFNVSEIRFLGHIISKDGVKADITNLKDFEMAAPNTKKKLQKILGYINWFRPFIKDFATLASSLYSKLKGKEEKFIWTEDDNAKLKEIIKRIKNNQILYHPDLNEEFCLEVDASRLGLGATLYQKGKIIGLYSYLFKNSELNYTISEKEFYAILKSLNHFRQLILGTRVIIKTDHANNLYDKDLTQRQQRWRLLLQEFDYRLDHVKGKENVLADILSRSLPKTKIQSKMMRIEECKRDFKGVGIELYLLLISELKQLLEEGKHIEIIYNKLRDIHEILTHPGYLKMMKTLSERMNVNKIRAAIRKVCEYCVKCQKEKDNYFKPTKIGFIKFIPDLHDCISIDIKGPVKRKHFKTTAKTEIFYILVITEILSRYSEVVIINDIHSKTVCDAIERNWFDVYGCPKYCITDNGRQFRSENFKTLLKINQINHITTSPHNPSGNSVVERINREIGIALRLSRGLTLKECVAKIWRRINLTVNRITGYSPYRIFCKSDNFKGSNETNDINVELIKERLFNQVEKNIKENNKNNREFDFKKGDLILKRNFDPDKIAPRFKGPFKVIDIGKMRNSLLIDEGNKVAKVSVKNVKLFKREGECETRTSSHISNCSGLVTSVGKS
ncbi:Transposon Tf2-6 polyprotein [Dictyocoela roeselum]|nr:Transposon Tf2-6 polyprotein [Dictyocoela roeselum]